MKSRKIKFLKIYNAFSISIIIVGLLLMFYSAYLGDRYRLSQQGLKCFVFFCMITLTTNVLNRSLCKMKNSTKYGVVALISILLMLSIFILNNVLHQIGFISIFSERIEVPLFQFFIEDLRYMNFIGLYRYIGIPAVTMTMFYIVDKETYRVLANPFKKIALFVLRLFYNVFNKLGLNEIFGIRDVEDNINDYAD